MLMAPICVSRYTQKRHPHLHHYVVHASPPPGDAPHHHLPATRRLLPHRRAAPCLPTTRRPLSSLPRATRASRTPPRHPPTPARRRAAPPTPARRRAATPIPRRRRVHISQTRALSPPGHELGTSHFTAPAVALPNARRQPAFPALAASLPKRVDCLPSPRRRPPSHRVPTATLPSAGGIPPKARRHLRSPCRRGAASLRTRGTFSSNGCAQLVALPPGQLVPVGLLAATGQILQRDLGRPDALPRTVTRPPSNGRSRLPPPICRRCCTTLKRGPPPELLHARLPPELCHERLRLLRRPGDHHACLLTPAVRSRPLLPSGRSLFRRQIAASSFCRSPPPAPAGRAPSPILAWSPTRR